MSGAEKVVCVTGASGYIASWVVKLLLQRGYTVNATLRDPNDPKKTEYYFHLMEHYPKNDVWFLLPGHSLCARLPPVYTGDPGKPPYIFGDSKKTEHLLALDGAKERLHLFKADLVEEGSFDSAVDGCEGVFHTASPVLISSTDPQAELIDPAVKGTINVLRSCAKVPSVKRVIVTSSLAAAAYNGKPLTIDVVVDETWFSDALFCEKWKNWYVVSKTLAEEAAWRFAKENEIDLVTINPGIVIGPLLQPTLNLTTEDILKLIDGAQTFPNSFYKFVDVRDVANAHIQALEVPSAAGRYCVVESTVHCSEVIKILRKLFPTLRLPEKCDDKLSMPAYQVSKGKAKSLGINFIPLEVTLKDTVESLKQKGFFCF